LYLAAGMDRIETHCRSCRDGRLSYPDHCLGKARLRVLLSAESMVRLPGIPRMLGAVANARARSEDSRGHGHASGSRAGRQRSATHYSPWTRRVGSV